MSKLSSKQSNTIENELKRISESTGLGLEQVKKAYGRYQEKMINEDDDKSSDEIPSLDDNVMDTDAEKMNAPKADAPPVEPLLTTPVDADKICMDVPLLMKVLEYSREEVKNDIELHRMVTNLIALSKEYPEMNMDHYGEIIKDVQGDELTYLKKLAGIQANSKK